VLKFGTISRNSFSPKSLICRVFCQEFGNGRPNRRIKGEKREAWLVMDAFNNLRTLRRKSNKVCLREKTQAMRKETSVK